MIMSSLDISGVFEIQPSLVEDERGYFGRIFCADEFASRGLQNVWAQANTSYSRTKGTIRGLHFQYRPSKEAKLVRCVSGSIIDVILDLREDSPTFGLHCKVMLDSIKQNAVYVPVGCAHGFQTLTDDVQLTYLHSSKFEKELDGGVNPMDPALGISWPLAVSHISPKDLALPTLEGHGPL